MVNKENNPNNFEDYPIMAAMEVMSGKWKPLILYNLISGSKRFGEIAGCIPAISRKALTEQLKELAKYGLVVRQPYKEIPPRVEYSLTDKSKSLAVVFNAVAI